ncbi:hypothetical protein [Nocardioides sp.]|uniref:hypothetical protein n=1 Tax=Nocardioides sp. TaxID=35761 RepID=UPI003D0FFC0E
MESNTSSDPSNATASAGERRLARLVVPAPSAYEPHQRIDWVHDPPSPADVDQGAPRNDGGRRGPGLPDA